ncbi:nucleotide-binding universal stress UspA family protein [Halohasta litchfieldiae]|jgi:nucleotide-binding universal stress UspA family protein|uniref:Nucleotide-binding universal stress protein, UspA family n=1 Tax=Halohasta litchfieldiae TaxID=1073996 RepID=A0A1H6TSN8_9EURY|nr:universal stress protein [Halohasta litchfieldiae]ATW88880.1 nucleotide-binding universal stress UspA family protein [Halohasta litchfieldiae]SEI80247.1 Nucleotide-binding universal stress protein, UspA family [Halohasta litchfieldiae]
MVSHILVPMDDSEMAETALQFALETFPDAEITVLHVAGSPTSYMGGAMSLAISDDIDDAVAERAEPVLTRARELAAEAGCKIETEVDLGMPAKTIIEHASEYDQVIIGSHSSSSTLAERLLLGNVAETVAHESPVPVTIVH